MKKLPKIFSLLLIFNMLLNACGPSAAAPAPSEPELINLVIHCGDLRTDLNLLLGPAGITSDIHVIRRITGPAGMTVKEFQAIAEMFAKQGKRINSVDLITHTDDACPGCGGLRGYDTIVGGGTIHPPEIDQWLRTHMVPADPLVTKDPWVTDPYLLVIDAAEKAGEAFPGVEINSFITTNSSQQLIAVETRGKEIYTFITPAEWRNWPDKPLPLTASTDVHLTSEMRTLLAANEAALPNAQAVALNLNYSGGQSINDLILSTRTDAAAIRSTAGSFQITVIPGEELSAIEQISYGLFHTHEGTNLTIIAEDQAELGRIIDTLDASQTFSELMGKPTWKGMVFGELWPIDIPEGISVALKSNKLITAHLYRPLFENYQGLAVQDAQLNVPAAADLNEASLVKALAEAGVPTEESMIKSTGLLKQIIPYAGKTLRVVAVIGEVTGSVLLAIYLVYDVSNIVFAWGPTLPVNTWQMLPSADPDVLNKIRMQVPSVDGALRMTYPYQITTAGSGMDMRQMVHNLEERLGRGDQPSFSLYLLNPTFMNNIPLLTQIDALNSPTPLVISYGASVDTSPSHTIVVKNVINGNTVTFTSTDGGAHWSMEGDPNSLSWIIPSKNWPGLLCKEKVSFDAADNFRIMFTPSCETTQ